MKIITNHYYVMVVGYLGCLVEPQVIIFCSNCKQLKFQSDVKQLKFYELKKIIIIQK